MLNTQFAVYTCYNTHALIYHIILYEVQDFQVSW